MNEHDEAEVDGAGPAAAPPAGGRRSGRARAGRLLIAACLIAVGAGVATLVVHGSERRVAPVPKVSLGTTTVQKGNLITVSRYHGKLIYPSRGTAALSGSGTVTSLPRRGQTLTEGGAVAGVDDRAVGVLYGRTALYRTLGTVALSQDELAVQSDRADLLSAEATLTQAQSPVSSQGGGSGSPGAGTTSGSPGATSGSTTGNSGAGANLGTAGGNSSASTTSSGPASGNSSDATSPAADAADAATVAQAQVGVTKARAALAAAQQTLATAQVPETGPDVALVADDMTSLGYFSGATDTWSATLQAAVRQWQEHIGAAATGQIGPGDVVVLPGPARVSSIKGGVGDGTSSVTISLSSPTPEASYHFNGSAPAALRTGRRVQLSARGETATGHVVGVKTKHPSPSSGAQPSATVTVAFGGSAAFAGLPAGRTSVAMSVTTNDRRGVLTVSTQALLALASGGYALQLPDGHLLAIHTGAVQGTQIAVSGPGVHPGLRVVSVT